MCATQSVVPRPVLGLGRSLQVCKEISKSRESMHLETFLDSIIFYLLSLISKIGLVFYMHFPHFFSYLFFITFYKIMNLW